MKKFFKIILLVTLIGVGIAYYLIIQTKPVRNGIIKSELLKDKVTVEWNKWGIPIIKAKNKNDLFFAIGFLQANDRLFQMDLMRRLPQGKLSEIFGKRTLNIDKFHKSILVDESIEQTIKQINPKLKGYFQAFCDGVNYYIKNNNLPLEFKILGYKPEKWEIKDSISILKRMELILSTSGSELINLKILNNFDKETAKRLIYGNYGETIVKRDEFKNTPEITNDTISYLMGLENQVYERMVGSNNWVISGKLTETGKPILANDPHLSNLFPGFFYQVYADLNGFTLSGNVIPGMPFIIIGRNSNIAWGVTNIGTDVIDYFELTLNPENKNQYLVDNKWTDFEIIKKRIKIKGEKDYVFEVKNSIFGPIVENNGKFYARHSLFLYKSTTPEGFYLMNFSKDIDEFKNGVSKFTSPAQNVVFADISGNIGYYPSGLIPIRAKGDGSLPIKVASKNDSWKGFYNENEKPIVINPQKGYIVTANNPVISDTQLPIFSKTWYPSFRADRIEELIKSREKISMDFVKNIQLDTYSKPAEFLIKKINNIYINDKKAKFIYNKLKKWNLKLETGVEPYLFYKFEDFLSQEIFNNYFKKDISYSLSWIYKLLDYPEFKQVNKNLLKNLSKLYENALIKTYNEFKKKEYENLNWKNLHKVYYKHPLGSVFGFLNRGPYFMKGGKRSVLRSDFSKDNFLITHLSSLRIIYDFSNMNNSLMINSTGQSGNFLSKHYDDQIHLYVNLKYRKLENFSKTYDNLVFTSK